MLKTFLGRQSCRHLFVGQILFLVVFVVVCVVVVGSRRRRQIFALVVAVRGHALKKKLYCSKVFRWKVKRKAQCLKNLLVC